MENLQGLDVNDQPKEKAEIVSLEPKRKPFHVWEVDGVGHRMKLNTGMIAQLENKYRRNLLNIISDEGLPPLSVMLTVAQAAITPWEHGTTYQSVEKLYDTWVEVDGGSQTDLLSDVIIPTMAVSGFFTQAQAEQILDQMERSTKLL